MHTWSVLDNPATSACQAVILLFAGYREGSPVTGMNGMEEFRYPIMKVVVKHPESKF